MAATRPAGHDAPNPLGLPPKPASRSQADHAEVTAWLAQLCELLRRDAAFNMPESVVMGKISEAELMFLANYAAQHGKAMALSRGAPRRYTALGAWWMAPLVAALTVALTFGIGSLIDDGRSGGHDSRSRAGK